MERILHQRPAPRGRPSASRRSCTAAVAVLALVLTGTAAAPTAVAAPAPSPAPPPGSAAAAEARPVRSIALGQVLQTAIRVSPTLADAEINVAVAQAQVLQAEGIDDWILSAGATWTFDKVLPVKNVFVQKTGVNNTVSVDAQFSKLLSTGGTVTFGASAGFSHQNQIVQGGNTGGQIPPATIYNAGITIGLTQPLLRGRGYVASHDSYEQNEIARSASELAHRQAAINMVRDLVGQYWELSYAERNVAILQSSVNLAQEQLRITQTEVKAGSVAPNEALAVEQVIASRKGDVLTAQVAATQQALNLRQLAGLEIGPGEVDLHAAEPLAAKPHDYDLDRILEKALAASPQVAELETQGKGARIQVEVADNGLLPQLDASINAGPASAADSVGTALSQIGKFQVYQVTAGLRYTEALGNHGARGARAVARENLHKITIDLADAKRQVATAVVQAIQTARAARLRMQLARRTIALAKKNIEAEKARFQLGRSTNFDVLQRQEDLKQAQLGLARATVDYLRADAAIDALTGEILPKYGIKVTPREQAVPAPVPMQASAAGLRSRVAAP